MLRAELLFSRVKSHLPEVTIKTHLSAHTNVFIHDSTLEIFTCSFVVSWPSLKSKVFEQMLLPDSSEVCHLEQIFNSYNIDRFRGLLPLRLWHPFFFKWSPGESTVKGAIQCHTSLAPTNLPASLLSLGRPLSYSEFYQMWQLWTNKVEVFNKCCFSCICAEGEWEIPSTHLKAIPLSDSRVVWCFIIAEGQSLLSKVII